MAMLLLPGFSDQEVVRLEVPLPLFPAVLGARVKLMLVPDIRVTVSDSFNVAFNVTVPILELTGAAAALPTANATRNVSATTNANFRMCVFICLPCLQQRNDGFDLVRPILGQTSKCGTRS